MNKEEIENIEKAGKIARETVAYAKTIVKKGAKVLDLANHIEKKIYDLGGRPAFPVNLSMNDTAAHDTPSWNDERKAEGLLKVDIGVHVDGYVADTAISFDLENSSLNKKLIEAAQSGLKEALLVAEKKGRMNDIGKAVHDEVVKHGFVPIVNLSGHSIERYDLHAGVTVPNYANGDNEKMDLGLYAIEPFTTNGSGKVRDGRPSGIYQIQKEASVRDNFAREVLAFIIEEYSTLPFASRWIHAKFGTRGLLALRQIQAAGILHEYAQLVETGKGIVAQAEHTVLVTKDKVVVTTRD